MYFKSFILKQYFESLALRVFNYVNIDSKFLKYFIVISSVECQFALPAVLEYDLLYAQEQINIQFFTVT